MYVINPGKTLSEQKPKRFLSGKISPTTLICKVQVGMWIGVVGGMVALRIVTDTKS